MLDITRAYGLDFLFPEKDTVIGASLRTYGEFARAELDLICEILGREPAPGAYIDVGANIGAIALPVAARFPGWSVVAVEAHRGLSGVLAANALNNRLYNVEVIQAAAGPRSQLTRFPSKALSGEGNYGVMSVGNHQGFPTETVRMCTLDEIAPSRTRFVKLDTEGFEAQVLRGAQAVVRDQRPSWILETRLAPDEAARFCMKVLLEAGYRLFWFAVPFVLRHPLRGGPREGAAVADLNLLALPNGVDLDWGLPSVTSAEAPWPELSEAYGYQSRYSAQQ